jgi:triphosphoribosyl-dephospho-CoA synthase
MIGEGRIDEDLARAFITACEAELQACKPGNVHVHADGHRMVVDDFRRSAEAAAPYVADLDARVGERILRGVEASLAVAGQNTNLGILLLCAPLAAAAGSAQRSITRDSLRKALAGTLSALNAEDARSVFAAVAMANPGGLGERERHDVRRAPRISLRLAMRLAAGRDRIAAAYGNDFADIFEYGLDVLASARRGFSAEPAAVSALYLGFLGEFPDSHIARKFGRITAMEVKREAASVRGDFYNCAPDERLPLLMAFDASLKERSLNPGTSADFTVATLFAETLLASETGMRSSG